MNKTVIPKFTSLVTPAPFYQIFFQCDQRSFDKIVNDLYLLSVKSGFSVGICTRSYNSDGTVKSVDIVNNKETSDFVNEILSVYSVPNFSVPDSVDLKFTKRLYGNYRL